MQAVNNSQRVTLRAPGLAGDKQGRRFGSVKAPSAKANRRSALSITARATTKTDELFTVRQLKEKYIQAIRPSFADLPENPWVNGLYRHQTYRRYSVVAVEDDKLVLKGNDKPKCGVCDNLSDELINNPAFQEIVEEFRAITEIDDDSPIEVHQFRAYCEGEMKDLHPTVHRDGFDHVGVLGVTQQNLDGAELILVEDRNDLSKPLMRTAIKDPTFAVFNDHAVWHGATQMTQVNPGEKAWVDCFVFWANKHKKA
mmetsp:Transcript_38477/g.46440  ORF Transcript_38477/g.46440 Transcript_38477/m.46440 type:complete len:255 (+) Transcript_38477:136-900(+)|eukprot:CAMPEP_0197848594 /NCGR_PEP_ID=MMETSP1438-20131217/9263_1 /TAXON_ID=1461541 /ORGANISM="Pterosperma sp., Strain CCMP1384" /LENGTH=254 /DNA_ID=CAMNT_0043460919 /DNA_START=122 /DNA_END=886 /DNA_ORIENTATION=+